MALRRKTAPKRGQVSWNDRGLAERLEPRLKKQRGPKRPRVRRHLAYPLGRGLADVAQTQGPRNRRQFGSLHEYRPRAEASSAQKTRSRRASTAATRNPVRNDSTAERPP